MQNLSFERYPFLSAFLEDVRRPYFLFLVRVGGREGGRVGWMDGICALTELDRGERPTSPRIDNNRGTRNKKGDSPSPFFFSLSRLIYSILLPNPVCMDAGNQFPTPLLHPFRAAVNHYPASMAGRNKRVIDKYDDLSLPSPPPLLDLRSDVRGCAQTRSATPPRVGTRVSIFYRRRER
jgi:hypothetical protein